MESAPNSSFDSEPSEPSKPSNGKESSKKFTPWSPAVSPARRIEHAGGASLPEAEKRLPFRSLGERNTDAAHPERETYTHPAVEDLGVAATKEEREQLDTFLRAREQEISESHKADTEKDNAKGKNSESSTITPSDRKKSETATKKPAERDAFDEFVENHKELADLSKEALAEMSIDVPDAAQDSGPDVAFEEFTRHEEADVPIDSVAEAAKEQIAFQPPAGHPELANDPVELAAFKGFLQEHGELANLSAEAIHEAPVIAESTESPLSDDDTFRKLVSDEGFPDPGSTTWQEGEPGTPPTAEGGDNPPVPPVPPTAEGGAYDDAHEPGGFGEQNLPNPNVAQNPWTPAGDLLNPATIAGISAIEAHQELNTLRNTAKIKGLEAAVGILGLGLIFEHFGAKRRHKRSQRQIKAQGKELAQTNKTLGEEQSSHLRTQQELQRLKRAHMTTSERLHEMQRHDLPKVETVAGVGTIAAAEIANRLAAQKTEMQRQQRQEEATIADLTLAETMTPEGPVTLHQQEGIQQAMRRRVAPELAEAAAAAVYANTIKQEMRHERLQDKLADTGTTKGTTVHTHQSDQSGMPILPSPSADAGTITDETPVLSAAERAQQSRHASQLASRWTWAIIGLIIVAAAAALFG